MTKSRCFLFSIYIFGDAASYFLGMMMLIWLLGTLAQIQSGVRQVTHPSKGPMLGQYVFIMAKYCAFYGRFLFKLLFLEI